MSPRVAPVSPPCRPRVAPCRPVSPRVTPCRRRVTPCRLRVTVSPRGLVFHCLGQHETTVDRGSTVVYFIFGTTAKYPVVPKIKFGRWSEGAGGWGYGIGAFSSSFAGSANVQVAFACPLVGQGENSQTIHWRNPVNRAATAL